VAAGLTFYAAIAVVPLMLSALYLAGLLVGEDTVMGLGAQVIDYAPSQLGLSRALTALRDVGPGLGIASFLAGLIPATTYGEGLLRAFTRFSSGGDPSRKSVRGRVTSGVFLAAFPLITVAGLFAVATVERVLGQGLGAQVAGVYLSFLFGWFSTTLVLALTYGAFGARRVPVVPLLWGAGSAASFLSGMTLGWLAALRIGVNVGDAYGGSQDVGSAVLFVVYLYLVQYVLLTGYVLTLELARRRT
jgi:membrane protein